jgi:orc1/cdc6 family replication initiation protein
MCDPEQPVLMDADILSEGHLSAYIHAREPHLNEITLCLKPIAEGRKPVNCWLHGRPGAGKTATAKYILRKLKDDAGINGIHVNCWENPTFFSVLERIALELRMLGADKLSTSFRLERIKRHISNERLVIVLDEIDQAPPKERHAILYNLSDLPTIGLICACNSQHVYFGLEERVKSRLNPVRILFEAYSPEDLFYILNQRAQEALAPDSYTEVILQSIAELADGDARIAIHTLKNAAYFAENEKQAQIKASHVRRAWNSAKDLKISYLLRKLTDHHRLLYGLIEKKSGILSGDLWRLYLKTCGKSGTTPIAVRTYSDYCNKLIELGLVQAKRAAIQGKVREFHII